MRFSKPVRRRSSRRRTPAEPPARQHDTHADQRAIQLRFVHVRNGALGVVGGGVEDIRYPAIRHELLVHRHFQFRDVAVRAEDLAEVRFVDVFG